MELEEVMEMTQEVVGALCSEDRAKELVSLIENIGEVYFTAPASSKESYHSCYPGGLAEHNLNVLQNLVKLNETFDLGFKDESICVVSLLHDIGKTKNTSLDDYYQATEEKWKIERGEKYQGVQGEVYMPTHQRSVWLCQQFGFKLSAEEYQAVLLNDGQHVNENKVYSMKECDLAIALHMADMLALMQEKKGNQEK